MDAVRKQVEELVKIELDSANEMFPMFHSMHEAYAVMKEEYEECKHELALFEGKFSMFWEMIKSNVENVALERTIVLKNTAIRLSVEAIQLAAMAQKTIDSVDGRGKSDTE